MILNTTQQHYARWAEGIPEAVHIWSSAEQPPTIANPLYLYAVTPDLDLKGNNTLRYVCFDGLVLLYATLREQGDAHASWMLAALLLQFQRGLLTLGAALYMMQYNTLGALGLGMSSYCPDCYEKPWDASLMFVMKPTPNHCYLCQIPFFDEEV